MENEKIADIKELLSQGKMIFLIGAGCSKCVGLPLIRELSSKVEEKLNNTHKEVLLEIKNNFSKDSNHTIEDYMSEIVDFISILKRRKTDDEKKTDDEEKIQIREKSFSLQQLIDTLDEIKNTIADLIKEPSIDIQTHRKFIRSLFQLRKNKEWYSPVDFFILNYDTLFEDSIALEKIKFTDGFNGSATAYWDLNNFEDTSVKARVFKIHGSIDWFLLQESDSQLSLFKVRDTIKFNSPEKQNKNILIWPMASKYQEAQNNPYLQIIQKFRESIKKNKDTVLGVLGYSFKDNHINEEIRIALEQFGEGLTCIIFIKDDPEKIPFLKEIRANPDISQKIKVYSEKGFFHGNEREKTQLWKFEDVVQILSGENIHE